MQTVRKGWKKWITSRIQTAQKGWKTWISRKRRTVAQREGLGTLIVGKNKGVFLHFPTFCFGSRNLALGPRCGEVCVVVLFNTDPL